MRVLHPPPSESRCRNHKGRGFPVCRHFTRGPYIPGAVRYGFRSWRPNSPDPCACCPCAQGVILQPCLLPWSSFISSKAALTALPFVSGPSASRALFTPGPQLPRLLRGCSIQNQNQTDLNFSLSSVTYLLCDSGQVTYPLRASVSLPIKWIVIISLCHGSNVRTFII